MTESAYGPVGVLDVCSQPPIPMVCAMFDARFSCRTSHSMLENRGRSLPQENLRVLENEDQRLMKVKGESEPSNTRREDTAAS